MPTHITLKLIHTVLYTYKTNETPQVRTLSASKYHSYFYNEAPELQTLSWLHNWTTSFIHYKLSNILPINKSTDSLHEQGTQKSKLA